MRRADFEQNLGGVMRLVAEAPEESLQEAERYARGMLERARRGYGPESLETAAALDMLVHALTFQGDVEEPLVLARESLSMKERIVGPDDRWVVTGLLQLGELLRTAGDYDAALEVLTRHVSLSERYYGPGAPEIAMGLLESGRVRESIGDYDGARRDYERSRTLREQWSGPDSPFVAEVLNRLAALSAIVGDYPQSRRQFERALAIGRRGLPPGHALLKTLRENFASLLELMGNYEDALAELRIVVGEAESLFPEDSIYWSGTHLQMGRVLQRLGRSGEAEEHWQVYLDIEADQRGDEHPVLAVGWDALAQLRQDAGRLAEAAGYLNRSLAVREKGLGPEHPEVASSLLRLARLEARSGPASCELPSRAVDINETSLGPSHPRTAAALAELASCLLALGRPNEAMDAAVRAEVSDREHVRTSARTLPERQALSLLRRRVGSRSVLVSAALADPEPERVRRAWDQVVRSRSLVHGELSRRRSLWGHAFGPEQRVLLDEFEAASRRLSNLRTRGPVDASPERYRKSLRQAVRDRDEAERRVAAGVEPFRNGLDRAEVGLDAVLAALPPGAALLSFVQYHGTGEDARREGSSYAAFVGRGDGSDPVVIPLGGEVKRVIGELRHAVVQGRGLVEHQRAYGLELRRLLWDPVEPVIGRAETVFVVPGGDVALVSLAALPREQGGYLIQDEDGILFNYLGTERELARPSRPPRPIRRLLAMGAPDFQDRTVFAAGRTSDAPGPVAPVAQLETAGLFRGSRAACLSLDGTSWEPLPDSAREVETLAAGWRDGSLGFGHDAGDAFARLLTASEATETHFKLLAPQFDVLHLSTHGVFDDGSCRREDHENDVSLAVLELPDRLSGLAFAGASRLSLATAGEDDAILTSEEITAMDLSGVECVVLSACGTGIGPTVGGEGVLGLRRAFSVAGARTVVMSLWPVEDEATRYWMESFYRHRAEEGVSTARAAHQATLESLQRRAGESEDLRYWGAFVVAGVER